MTFTSTEVVPTDAQHFQVKGNLSIHGVSKPVVFDTEFAGMAKDPGGHQRAAFNASTTINRKDFGLKWDDLTETGGVLVGDDVKITLEIEAVQDVA